jgi:hypothetical protein
MRVFTFFSGVLGIIIVILLVIAVVDALAAPANVRMSCNLEQSLLQSELLPTGSIVYPKSGFPKLRKSSDTFACRSAVDLYQVQNGGSLVYVKTCYRKSSLAPDGSLIKRGKKRCS